MSNLTDREAAKILGLGVQTLRNYRHVCKGPAYIKLGRAIRYREADLLAYIEKNRIDPERSEDTRRGKRGREGGEL